MGLEPGALGGDWVGTCVKRWGSARQGLGKSQEGRDLKDTDVQSSFPFLQAPFSLAPSTLGLHHNFMV